MSKKMNKHSLYISLTLLLHLLVSASCNEWIDVQPRSQVEDTELFSTENGYKEALAGIYSSMVSTNTYAKELTYGFVGVLAQEWSSYYATQYDDAAAYDYESTYPTNLIRNIWSTNYAGIANANNLLAHIDGDKNLFSDSNYAIIKGEALALRAMLHFDLLRCFGVSFAVNADQAAIPYSTALSYKVFPQLSVRQVSDAVIADLLAAESLLKDADPIVTGHNITEQTDNGYLLNRQLHLNYYAVKGLQARAYLWAGRYDEAYDAAKTVIDSEVFPWVTVANMQAGTDRNMASEHLFALNNLTMTSDVAQEFFADDSPYSFSVTRERLLDYFNNATQDYRYTFLFKAGTATHASYRYLMKYDASSSSNSFYQNKMPLIRLGEMYLIKSETEHRNGDDEKARTTLNQLRKARNLTALNALPADYELELIKEYRRELIGEGQLFFLYKRLNRTNILYSDIDAVATKSYTFPLPITETESAQREDNR